ncbi:MAG TPA: SDR family NAD(P)-dependent oxidoreductase [Casimicrobiaceae bacterium]|nr:SDR family NAD(P)-dependent oxidoreductase [Casimicrobiaceae bacterium]
MRIKGKNAIVTGGASGIGLGVCREFVRRGGRVAIFDLQAERAQQAVDELGATNAIAVMVNVADEQSVQAGIARMREAFGVVHVVVNCAGVPFAAKTVDREGKPFPLELWNRVIAVNLTGTFNVLRLAATAMIGNAPEDDGGERGVIVNIASGAAFDGQMGQAAYAASKAGVVGMTLPIARDLADFGIRVMSVAPGLFETPMVAGVPDKVRESLLKMVLYPRRMGEPQEAGAMVCAIVEIPYLNAECIRLDGGARMAAR